ncbi:hypothetical protein MRX96_003005 [Rhipicephalus microplus]
MSLVPLVLAALKVGRSGDTLGYGAGSPAGADSLCSLVTFDRLSTGEHVKSLPSLKWNCLSMSPAGISIDRRSWIVDADGTNIVYILESEGVPRNPSGRTGLKGKGALPRWGPNHYVLFIISRYQRSKASLLQGRGLEIALMKIFRTDQFVLPGLQRRNARSKLVMLSPGE